MKSRNLWSVRTLFQHSLLEYWMVIKAFIVVMIVKVLLRVLPYKKVLDIMEAQFEESQSLSDESLARYTMKVVRAVRAVARRFLGDKPCLPQALAVKYFLSKVGKASHLQIGVVKNAKNRLDAHAWLEVDGDIIIGGRRLASTFVKLTPINSGT